LVAEFGCFQGLDSGPAAIYSRATALFQNKFTGCRSTVSSQCAGTEDALSLAVDWRFAKKFDAYAGFMYSKVNNGLASGFLFNNTINPTAGLRFRF
jgi:hypothetical protein